MNQVFRNVAEFPPAGQFVCVTGTFQSQGLGSSSGIRGFVNTGTMQVGLFIDLSNLNPLSLLLATRQLSLLNNQTVRACGISAGMGNSGFATMVSGIPNAAPGATPGISPGVDISSTLLGAFLGTAALGTAPIPGAAGAIGLGQQPGIDILSALLGI